MALSEFARIRKAATQSARRLEKAGISAPHFPTAKQLKGDVARQQAIREMKAFMSSPQHTIAGARAAADLSNIADMAERARKNRERAKPLLDYMQSEKYKNDYIKRSAQRYNLTKHEQDLLRSLRFKHGIKGNQIATKDMKQFAEYADFRFSIKNERGYYIDEFVKQYNNIKKNGDDWKKIKADFDAWRADQRKTVAADLLKNKKYSRELDAELWDRYVADNYDY